MRPIGFGVRRPAARQLVERHAQPVDVRPRIAPAVESLGRQVPQGAQEVAGVGQRLRIAGVVRQPEVGHPHRPPLVEQEVRRLDVAVDDALGVGIGQRLGRLHADPCRLAVVEPARDGAGAVGDARRGP